jgi:Tol biopolymer transport system component
MRVYVTDRVTGRTELGSQAIDFAHDHHSAYNPSLSADGRVVAYETSESAHGELDVWVTDLRRHRSVRIPEPAGVASDLYEPSLSPDGRFLAFTALERGGARESTVFLRDLRRGTTRPVSTGSGEAWEPAVSRGGRVVAYTRGTRVVVQDARGETAVVVPPDASMSASEPSISADGRRVAFTARGAGGATSVYVYDVATRRAELASRASGVGGPPAMGASSHPSLSADGTRVAFTSDAWNLSPAKCNPARGIFVRDLVSGTTTLVSRGDGMNAGLGPTKGSGGTDTMRVRLLCAV